MISRTLLLALAAMLGASTALAAPSGFNITRMPNGAILATRISLAQQQKQPQRIRTPSGTDFDNFDTQYVNAPYTPWNGYFLCGASDADNCGGNSNQLAMAFTTRPTGSQYAKGLDLALSVLSGSGGATVAIYNDDGGVPGTALSATSEHVTASTAFGTLGPILQTAYTHNVKLANSTQYWVVVTPDSDSAVAWDIEDTDYTDFYLAAAQTGTGAWEDSYLSAYVPAFDVVK
jgi:hypothetical protein